MSVGSVDRRVVTYPALWAVLVSVITLGLGVTAFFHDSQSTALAEHAQHPHHGAVHRRELEAQAIASRREIAEIQKRNEIQFSFIRTELAEIKARLK